jgi:mono/diheme cytochrome c family protein
LVIAATFILAAIYGIALIRRGFSAADEPSALEKVIARSARRLAVPNGAANGKNPLPATANNLKAGNEIFTARCAGCHGIDGSGQTKIGRNLYPKPPDLRLPPTQDLTDGEIHYVIQNGVRLCASRSRRRSAARIARSVAIGLRRDYFVHRSSTIAESFWSVSIGGLLFAFFAVKMLPCAES